MLNLQDRYDWIVLGQHPAALMTASWIARKGLSVLILPAGPSVGLKISKTGQHFDPESNFLLGVGGASKGPGLISHVLAEAFGDVNGAQKWAKASFRPSTLQLLTPVVRFALTENEALSFELQREFGKDAAAVLKFDEALKDSENDYLGFWEFFLKRLETASRVITKPGSQGPQDSENARSSTRSSRRSGLQTLKAELRAKSKLDRHSSALWPNDEETLQQFATRVRAPWVKEVLSGLWFGVSSTLDAQVNFFDFFHLMALSRTGGSVRGGITAYREFLIRQAKGNGAHFADQMECRRIFVEHGKFAGVQTGLAQKGSAQGSSLDAGSPSTAAQGEMISAEAGVLGCSLETALSRLHLTGKSWAHQRRKPPQLTGWKFTVSLTVRREALPPGSSDRMLWQENGAPPLEIEVVHPADYLSGHPEARIVHLRTVLPIEEQTLDRSYQRMIAARMIRQGMGIFPFLDSHILRIHPEFRSESRYVPELKEAYPFQKLEAIPDHLRVYAPESGLGPQSGITGLYAANDQSYPKLGSLGPVVAAVESVMDLYFGQSRGASARFDSGLQNPP